MPTTFVQSNSAMLADDESTSSSSFVDVPEMAIEMTTSGGPVVIEADMSASNTLGGYVVGVAVDGVDVPGAAASVSGGSATITRIVTPDPGLHSFTMRWKSSGLGTVACHADTSQATHHATLMVTEYA